MGTRLGRLGSGGQKSSVVSDVRPPLPHLPPLLGVFAFVPAGSHDATLTVHAGIVAGDLACAGAHTPGPS